MSKESNSLEVKSTVNGKSVTVGAKSKSSKSTKKSQKEKVKTREMYSFGISVLNEEDRMINKYLSDLQEDGIKLSVYLRKLILNDMNNVSESSSSKENAKIDKILAILEEANLKNSLATLNDKATIHEYMLKEMSSRGSVMMMPSMTFTQPQQPSLNEESVVDKDKDDILDEIRANIAAAPKLAFTDDDDDDDDDE